VKLAGGISLIAVTWTVASCIPPRLSHDDGGAPPPNDAAAELMEVEVPGPPDADTADTADGVADTADGGLVTPDSNQGPPGMHQISIPIAADVDDAVWIGGPHERLHYSDATRTIEVGTDAEIGRVGLRFRLPVLPASNIREAHLLLERETGSARATDSVQIQVYDSIDVAAFDGTHQHNPAAHDPAGLRPTAVTGFEACPNFTPCTSPDIKDLVRYIVERSDWIAGGYIGFVLSPDQFSQNAWASYYDSSSSTGSRASLELVYDDPS
jgi:hypothetical protein